MDQCLFWWFWEAIRLLCLSQQATMNTTHSICWSATFIILSAGGIKMLLLLLDFSPSQKVSCIIKLVYTWTDFIYLSSDQRTFIGSGISNVPPPTISQLTVCDPSKPKTSNDDTWNCSLWRWTLLKDNIWAWPIYSWLRRASATGLHCSLLVCTVNPLYYSKSMVDANIDNIHCSCTVTCGTLDSDPDTINRCRWLTETLFQNASSDQMWNEFGMVGDLVVCSSISFIRWVSDTNLFFFLSSHLPMTSLVLTYINSSLRIYSISSSKGRLRIIW